MKRAVLAFLLIISLMLSAVPAAAAASDDPYYREQTNLKRIGYSEAWKHGFNGRGVRIAVIDSGIYIGHEELRESNILQGINVIDRSAKTNDTSGHGTFIAAMLVAGRENGFGISGMVDKATLVPLKCFSSGRQTDARYIVSAIYMAVDEYNCDVINLSLGIGEDVPALRQAVNYADKQGVIVVASVGNTGGTAAFYPASYSCVVGVGSVSTKDQSSYFSQRNSSVYVVAPGEGLLSAGIDASDAYMKGSGTSFSAVHVTALAAIAKQYDRSIDNTQFKKLLRDSAEDLGEKGYDTTFGWGMVNTPAFISQLLQYEDDFEDIRGHWAESYIRKCMKLELFSGVSDKLFVPDGRMTRAMTAAVFYRMAGQPVIQSSSAFADVRANAWYRNAVAWAAQNGLVKGENGYFYPDKDISRQELAVMFYRYAAAQHMNVTNTGGTSFSDEDEIAVWARAAVAWCAAEGLIAGRPDGRFAPNETASRSEVAALLVRFTELSMD